jgi:AraC family transcriptional regulator
VHFARVFRKQYGAAPSTVIRQLRIRWAANRIRTTNDPLGAIASEAGFYDQAHFTRTFRAIAGLAPSRLRGRIRGSGVQDPSRASTASGRSSTD